MNDNGTYRWVKDNDPSPKKPVNWKKIRNIAFAVVLAMVLLIGSTSCFYTVDDKQQAVVTTFGKVTDVTDAGLHFKLPFGIQKARKVDVNVYQKIELGYASSGDDYYQVNENESTMITGDYNIVNVDFIIEYKVSDPERYLFASDSP